MNMSFVGNFMSLILEGQRNKWPCLWFTVVILHVGVEHAHNHILESISRIILAELLVLWRDLFLIRCSAVTDYVAVLWVLYCRRTLCCNMSRLRKDHNYLLSSASMVSVLWGLQIAQRVISMSFKALSIKTNDPLYVLQCQFHPGKEIAVLAIITAVSCNQSILSQVDAH